MNIGIIGAGSVGGALARACMRAGHSVRISAAHPGQAEEVALDTGAVAAASNAEAVAEAEIVILAVPYQNVADLAASLVDDLAGRVVIEVSNTPAPDLDHRLPTTSAAEEVADILEDASVVKAFNTIFAGLQETPVVDGMRLDGLYAGDDEAAKAKVAALLESLGFESLDCGPLIVARALEDMALINVRLNALNGWQWKTAWKLVGVRG